MFYAQSTGTVISGRYTSDIIYLIFSNVYVLNGSIYSFKTMLKRWKHKHNSKRSQIYIFPQILISSKKLKILYDSGAVSLNNMRSDLAVKWLSLISIKSEQVSKICSMVKRLSHPMHSGGFSPFNKKEWVRKEWPMCNRATTVSSSSFFRGQNIWDWDILYDFFSGNSSHSDCHSSNIYLCVRGFRSENGMSSTEMSPSRASLAAETAAEFPLMPTWPGTQMKTISLPSLVSSVCNSKIWTKTGWS